MKSTARIALVAVGTALLVPTIAFAQFFPGGGYIGTGPYNWEGKQSFSGGSSMFGPFGGSFGGIFPGGFGGTGGFGGGGMMGFGVVGVANTIIYIINGVLVPLLFAVSFIVFLYGVAKTYIFSTGDEEAVKSGHQIILWGLIGFAVMVSVWGLVNVVVATFGLATPFRSTYPTSFGTFSK